MVEVAQQQASNPMHDAAQALPVIRDLVSSWLPPPKLDIPNKITFPVYFPTRSEFTESAGQSLTWFVFVGYVMLGLGDIALPALLM